MTSLPCPIRQGTTGQWTLAGTRAGRARADAEWAVHISRLKVEWRPALDGSNRLASLLRHRLIAQPDDNLTVFLTRWFARYLRYFTSSTMYIPSPSRTINKPAVPGLPGATDIIVCSYLSKETRAHMASFEVCTKGGNAPHLNSLERRYPSAYRVHYRL